jgi:histidine decarboxylase
VALAKEFEALVSGHEHFEMPAKRHLGLVVFRLKGDNSVTESLLKKINSSGHLHVVPASLKGQYVIRFTVTSQHTTSDDIRRDWAFIKMFAEELIFPATNVKMKLKGNKICRLMV